MSRYAFKLPDLGEGTVAAEIVGWRVKPGDTVTEDDVIVEVMTEKAAVEVPAPVSGRVISTRGTAGDMVPVGSELIVFETQADPTEATPTEATPTQATPTQAAGPDVTPPRLAPSEIAATRPRGNGSERSGVSVRAAGPGRVATSPAIRRRAHDAGIDLTQLSGSGPNGRILPRDLEAVVSGRSGAKPGDSRAPDQRRGGGRGAAEGTQKTGSAQDVDGTQEIKVIGVRRLIAQRMSESKRNIPHFTYVEELDVTELESLRRHLNSGRGRQPDDPALTYLPFIVSALVRVLRDFPQCNALYDAERGVIVRHRAVHVGVATQTPDGLKVPVVRHAESLSLRELATRIRRVTDAARTNKASREELSGSTITVTSLGRLGGIVSTPIINAPEVAILGVNRALDRPVVHEGAIAIRRMMNLSSSFDHRFVDGHDAAAMIQAMKERLEHPATIFIE